MGSSEEHRELKNRIRLALGEDPNVACFNNEQGVATYGKRTVKYGVAKGGADLICLVAPHGTWLELEVKTGNARQTKEQQAHEKLVHRLGGYYRVARSTEDARAAVAQVRSDVARLYRQGAARLLESATEAVQRSAEGEGTTG